MKQRYKDIKLYLSNNQIQILLMLAGICCCVAMAMPQVHMVALCVDNGFGLQVGTEILAVMLYSGMLSRVIFGIISDRIGPILTLLLGSFLQMISLTFLILVCLVILVIESKTSFWIFGSMIGFFIGSIQPSSRTALISLSNPNHINGLFGIYATSGKITNFLGPSLVATFTTVFASQKAGMATILIF